MKRTNISILKAIEGRGLSLSLAGRLSIVLFLFLAACGGAPSSPPFRPAGPEFREGLFPPGAKLELPIGKEESFVLHGGQCLGFSYGAIHLSRPAHAELEIALEGAEGSSVFSRVVVEIPAAADQVKFPAPGSAREFFKISFRAKGEGEGKVTIDSPELIRALPADSLKVARAAGNGKKPDIIFIMIDTLRKDRLGCYGCPRELTPRIDAFARDSIVFDDAVAQSPWTRPSVASMFTGLPPYEHGVSDRNDALPETALVLPERLKAGGWATEGVITNGNVCAKFGFDQGFDEFLRAGGPAKKDGSHALDLALDIIDKRDEKRPLFLYFHLSDPHAPYKAPRKYRDKWAPGIDPDIASRDALRDLRTGNGLNDELRKNIVSLYEAEVALIDDLVGQMLDRLKEKGIYDDAMIILVADHGEEFWEHGIWGHGGSLHPALLEVPMMIKLPGMSTGLRSARMAQHIDLLPTILSVAGLPGTSELRGADLSRELLPEDRSVFSSVNKAGLAGISLTTERWKLVVAKSGLFKDTHGAIRLFDRKVDLKETEDLSAKDPESVHLLEGLLAREQIGRHRATAKEVSIHGDLRRELEALGYIEEGEKLKDPAN